MFGCVCVWKSGHRSDERRGDAYLVRKKEEEEVLSYLKCAYAPILRLSFLILTKSEFQNGAVESSSKKSPLLICLLVMDVKEVHTVMDTKVDGNLQISSFDFNRCVRARI